MSRLAAMWDFLWNDRHMASQLMALNEKYNRLINFEHTTCDFPKQQQQQQTKEQKT